MRLPFWIACGVATTALTAGTGAVQRDAPTLRFAAPTDDTYVSGPTRLVVVVEPAPATREIRGVTVFADGQQVCTIPRPPFECDWDAGAGVVEHQIRAVATLRSGGRTTATVRTKGLEHAEACGLEGVLAVADAQGDLLAARRPEAELGAAVRERKRAEAALEGIGARHLARAYP